MYSRQPILNDSQMPRAHTHHYSRGWVLCGGLLVLIIVLFLVNLFYGSVTIPVGEVFTILFGGGNEQSPHTFIVLESRLPQALTALLAGAGLAVSGLMLQTAFHNPLAGPSILGITSGASLGVALVILLLGGTIAAGTFSLGGYLAVTFAAFVGSMIVMGLLIFFSSILRSNLLLLIIGIMLGYLTSSVISLLNFAATAEGVQGYMIWGMGDFSGVSMRNMPFFAILTSVGIIMSLMLIKPLNVLLLGTRYAENLGVNLKIVRSELLLTTGLLTAVITAFCGPVSFLGLAVPHMARLMLKSNNHQSLMPVTLLTGAALALLCNTLCTLPGSSVIPLNAVTPLLGAPVIIYVIMSGRKQ